MSCDRFLNCQLNPFNYRVQADMNPKIFHYLIHHYFDVIPEIIIKVLSLNKISKMLLRCRILYSYYCY